MKILALNVENVLNLKAISLNPEGKSVTLTGPNGAGKSAILDAIFMGLTGSKCEEPIRQGEERGQVVVTLDKFVVKRVWTTAGSRLEISSRDEDAAIFSKPQALLDKILGDLTFNPLQFAELGKTEPGRRQQREILMRLAGLDFSVEEKRRGDLFSERATKNREVSRLEGALGAQTKPDEGLPATEVGLDDVLTKIKDLELRREGLHTYRFAKQQLENSGQRVRDEIATLEERLAGLKSQLQKNVEEIASLGAEPVVPSEQELATTKEELTGLDAKNRKIRAAAQFRETEKQLSLARGDAEALTKEIETIDADKAAKITAASYPLPGLSVDDAGVLFEGVPFSQQSTGRQIRISTAIAMALNPKLRVIMLRDASLLDSESLGAIVQLAQEQDYQLWVEKVDETGKVGVFIEDGEVRAVDGQPLKKEA